MIVDSLTLMKKIFAMKFPWNIWVAFLAGVNVAGGLFYMSRAEGLLALFGIGVSFLVMVIVYRQYGFVRLLGLGHVLPWTPFCLWLAFRLVNGHYDSRSSFGLWIISVLTLNSLSLVIDYWDIWRFFRGEKSEVH